MKDLIQNLFRNKKPLLIAILAIAVGIWFLGSSFLNLIHNKLELRRLIALSQELDSQYEKLKYIQKKNNVSRETLFFFIHFQYFHLIYLRFCLQ